MKSSVVIPVYNGQKHLANNLPKVLALGADEVVIIDDASTDDSVQFLTTKYPTIKLVRHPQNQGFPITVNDGFAVASGDIVFLLNQDVKPDKSLITKTLPHFADPQVFAVTFNEKGRSWADGRWTEGGMLEFTNGKLDNKLHDSLWPSGGSSAIRKDLWNKLGGFDPIFTPGYSEDLDLGLRAHAAGYKIIWDPACNVSHTPETSFNKAFSPQYLQYFKDRNYLLAMWRNMPIGTWPAHLTALLGRILRHPGYLVPTLWAIWKKLVS